MIQNSVKCKTQVAETQYYKVQVAYTVGTILCKLVRSKVSSNVIYKQGNRHLSILQCIHNVNIAEYMVHAQTIKLNEQNLTSIYSSTVHYFSTHLSPGLLFKHDLLFEQVIYLRKYGNTPAPPLTNRILYGVPRCFVHITDVNACVLWTGLVSLL